MRARALFLGLRMLLLLAFIEKQNDAYFPPRNSLSLSLSLPLILSLFHSFSLFLSLSHLLLLLQKRAEALRTKREHADAAELAAREKELARERSLMARPAPSLQAQLGPAGGGSG